MKLFKKVRKYISQLFRFGEDDDDKVIYGKNKRTGAVLKFKGSRDASEKLGICQPSVCNVLSGKYKYAKSKTFGDDFVFSKQPFN